MALLKGKTAYILGPMTGYKDDNRPAFREAAAKLRSMGYEVTSPDELDCRDPAKRNGWADFLRRDIPWLVNADIGVAIPGWRSSKGGTLEATILGQLGTPVYELHGTVLVPIPPSALPRPVHP